MPKGKKVPLRKGTDGPVLETPSASSDAAPSQPFAPVEQAAKQDKAGSRPRLTIRYDLQTGKPAWDRISDEVKGELRQLLKDPAAQQAIGLFSEPEQGLQPVETITPETAQFLFDGLAKIEAVVAAKLFRIPLPAASQIFQFKPDQKGLELTARVINKHSNEFMRKYQDEIGCGLMVAYMHQQAFVQAIELSRRLRAEEQAETPKVEKPNGPEAPQTAT